MSTRIHPQPGEPYCDNCHGDGDDSVTCNAAHIAWAGGFDGQDEIARLTSERDAALAEVARLKEEMLALRGVAKARELATSAFNEILDQRDQARSALSEALAALRRYGKHDSDCPAGVMVGYGPDPVEWKPRGSCRTTCGLDAVLRKGEGRDGAHQREGGKP